MIGVILVAPAALIFGGFFASEAVLHPPRRPLDAHSIDQAHRVAESSRAQMEDVEINAADGARLRGWLFRAADGNGRSVILLHGQADNRAGVLGYVPLFLNRGYDVLTPDMRAHGESGGNIATYGVKESDDVDRWAQWLFARHPGYCVFGLGESMGAAILLQTLGHDTRFCAVVAEAPFSSFRQVAYDRMGRAVRGGPWLGKTLFRPAVESGFLYARLRYGVSLGKAAPEQTVTGAHPPILLIRDLADREIPRRHSDRIAEHTRGHVEVWDVPDAGHTGAYRAHPSEFEQRVTDWFAVRPEMEAEKTAHIRLSDF